jgi:cobalt-precorrin 5A hydrolase/precorrin-3B C17-methyltransferase
VKPAVNTKALGPRASSARTRPDDASTPAVQPGPLTAETLAIYVIGRRGLRLADAIRRSLGGDVLVPPRWLAEAGEGTRSYGDRGLQPAVAEAFGTYRRIVLVAPLGVAVRVIAASVVDKRADPAVVVVDEAGKHAIALLSGHLGGANHLAEDVATVVGGRPVITTSAEVLGLPALDLLGQEWGWTLEDTGSLTRASAAIVGGEPIGAFQEAGEEVWWHEAPPHLVRYPTLDALLAADLSARLIISDRVLPPLPADTNVVVFRPRTLLIGVGCVRGATEPEIGELIERGLDRAGVVASCVRGLATIDVKRDEPGLSAVAERNGWSITYYTAEELAPLAASGGSATVERVVGTPAVCEPAALRAARTSELLLPKIKTRRVTVAIARVAHASGEGRLRVVGIGPGGRRDITEAARQALEASEVVVGYHAYLDLVRPWLGDKVYHGSPIGDERERCELVLELMAAGHHVALVCSGDAGIYGMAGLVLELLDEQGNADRTENVEVIPGVSAAQAAAALLGAPLMSDFATISLSDLMTPWATIEARLEGAAASDLVLALYNPASGRRRTQLERAQEILLRHRPASTPVGLVRNASRPGQTVTLLELGRLLDHPVDMLTTVVIGNSMTIRVGNRLTTRRGYLGATDSKPSPGRDRAATGISQARAMGESSPAARRAGEP